MQHTIPPNEQTKKTEPLLTMAAAAQLVGAIANLIVRILVSLPYFLAIVAMFIWSIIIYTENETVTNTDQCQATHLKNLIIADGVIGFITMILTLCCFGLGTIFDILFVFLSKVAEEKRPSSDSKSSATNVACCTNLVHIALLIAIGVLTYRDSCFSVYPILFNSASAYFITNMVFIGIGILVALILCGCLVLCIPICVVAGFALTKEGNL